MSKPSGPTSTSSRKNLETLETLRLHQAVLPSSPKSRESERISRETLQSSTRRRGPLLQATPTRDPTRGLCSSEANSPGHSEGTSPSIRRASKSPNSPSVLKTSPLGNTALRHDQLLFKSFQRLQGWGRGWVGCWGWDGLVYNKLND